MRALIQRVSQASVTVDSTVVGQISNGLLVFLGIKQGDTRSQAEILARKVTQLRVFADKSGKMNLSLFDIAGELLIVSQFTLYGDTAKGNRPSYSEAARPELAKELYEYFIQLCRSKGIIVATGTFQAHMQVNIVNDGPVTLLCEVEPERG